jgi:hypothetical protein
VPRATAQRIVHAVFGSRVSESGSLPAAVRAFAARLGIGTGAAARAVKQILALSRNGAVDRASPAFAAIAHGLGVSPAQLTAAWDAVKTSVVSR